MMAVKTLWLLCYSGTVDFGAGELIPTIIEALAAKNILR